MFVEIIGEYVSEDVQGEISSRLIGLISNVEMSDDD